MQVDIPLKDIQALKVMEKPQSPTLLFIALLQGASAAFRRGFGDIFSSVLLASGVSVQQLNRRKELI